MAWDPYDIPNAPRETRDLLPPGEPVKGRAVAAVLVGIVLLAIVFTIAANAQEATTQTGTGGAGQQGQEEQLGQPAQDQQAQDQQAQDQQAQDQQAQEPQGQDQQQDPAGAATTTESQPEAQAPAQTAEAQPLDGQIVEQAEGTYAASDLIGQPVITAEGEEMGKIADLLVGEDDRVAGAVIGIGGFLGFGEKRIAVEIDQLERTPTAEGGEQLALNFTRAELEQAPEFVSLAEQRRQQEAEQAQQGAGTGEQQPATEGQSLTQ